MSTSGIDPRDEQQSDSVFDRLKASDPAATAEPDTTVIRAKVDAAIGEAAEAPAGAVVDLAAQRRTRRPARWLQIAAAAAGVVAVGGGAFFAGQQTADAPISAETARSLPDPAVTSLQEPSVEGPAAGASSGFAAGASGESGRSASTMDMLGGGYGRTVFTSSGLSDSGSSAQAWGYDPSATFSAETAARVAAAFGVSGDPFLNYGAWVVGSADWTSAVVSVSSDAQTNFYFSDPSIEPWAENSTATGVSAEDAIAALTTVMVELGLDPATFTITTDDQDPKSTSVVAAPTNSVDGSGTWYATITSEGLVNLNGSLAPLVDLGTYDVVSPQAAVDRLADARFGANPSAIAYGVGDLGYARGTDAMTVAPDDPAAVPTLPGTPAPGTAIAWPVANVTITDATLGTGTFYQPDGSVTLLPMYTLTGSDGSAWTVIALADAHLDFAATS